MKSLCACTLLLLLLAAPVTAAEKASDAYGQRLGTVRIQSSCSDDANSLIERGVALLHHMTYDGARATFVSASETDPTCAMAYWGQAMTFIHPLWSDPPSEDDFDKGRALLSEAERHADKGSWQAAYIDAVEAYYAAGRNPGEKANLQGFRDGWAAVHRRYPGDLEAASFYALAHMATADPDDKTFARQKEAGAIAEKVLTKIPDHPGGHHYSIHAYDSPPLAEKALDEARNYGKIAPAVPHALHMPTHIFTRLGLWQDSIAMNARSAAAALEHPYGDMLSMHYLHALDYLAYAYLQRAGDKKARELLEHLKNLQGPFQPHVASAYTFAAVPARYALERQQWPDAVRLEPRQPETFPWDRYPAMEAITYFARALGAARSGDTEAAAEMIDKLETLRQQTGKTSPYWAKQIEIQQLAARAWMAFEEGRQEEALQTMRRAAELEASTEKHPVTPGEVLPARELLADMLLAMERYDDAIAKYEAALARSPKRFNSLYGAGRAAELKGDEEEAAKYYRKITQMAAGADSERERLQHAEEFLAGEQTSR